MSRDQWMWMQASVALVAAAAREVADRAASELQDWKRSVPEGG